MKIQEFINQNQKNHLSDELKQSIYQKVLTKINKSEKKGYSRFFYTKIGLGVFLVFGLGFLLYSNNVLIEKTDNGQIIKAKSTNTVYADNIAKIISFDGSYSIYHGDKVSQNMDISEGDTVVLDAGSKMTFNINSENYGEVYGPAKFSIRKEGTNKYFIDLNESEYFKFYKKVNPNSGIINQIFADSTETTINTTNYQIKGKNLNIIIAKKSNDETFLKNNGDSLTIENGTNQIDVPNNKIAKLDKDLNIIGSADDASVDETIKDKINNPDIILLSYEDKKLDNKVMADLVDTTKIEDYKTKIEDGKIFVKKIIPVKAMSLQVASSGATETGKTLNLLDEKDISYINPILNYKNVQARFDAISNKLMSYDRTYIEDVYGIGDNLAQIHTKLGLPINYYPNVYYIKYMAENLKTYFSKYDNVPNDYIYSLTYISKMMDELNQKKPGDNLVNDYNIVPEIIRDDQKNDSGEVNTGVKSNDIFTGGTGENPVSGAKIKDAMLQFKKQMHSSASGDQESGENL